MTTLKNQLKSLFHTLLNTPNMTELEIDELLLEVGDHLGYSDRIFDFFYIKMQEDLHYYSVTDLIDRVVEISSYLENEDSTYYL